MIEKQPRPCCICGMEFSEYGHNPEPFTGDVGMCCNDCNDRWVVPVRMLFGRDPFAIGMLAVFKKLAELGATCTVNAKMAREFWKAKQEEVKQKGGQAR